MSGWGGRSGVGRGQAVSAGAPELPRSPSYREISSVPFPFPHSNVKTAKDTNLKGFMMVLFLTHFEGKLLYLPTFFSIIEYTHYHQDILL